MPAKHMMMMDYGESRAIEVMCKKMIVGSRFHNPETD